MVNNYNARYLSLQNSSEPDFKRSKAGSRQYMPLELREVDWLYRTAYKDKHKTVKSPVNLDRLPNSTMKVPTPAVQVMGVSPSGTPWRRLTVPYGIPVGVSKAGSSRSAMKKKYFKTCKKTKNC